MISERPRPLRTCVGCGESKDKEALLRFSAGPDGSLVLNLRGRTGRGAYLCPTRACLELAIKRKGFQRTLKVALAEIDKEGMLVFLS